MLRLVQNIENAKASLLSFAYNHAFEVVDANTPELKEEAFRLRYKVFCLENNIFDAANYPDGMERDIYDDHAHHLLLKHRLSNKIIGTIRVVPFNPMRPHESFPMQTYCPHKLMHDYEQLSSMAEISRACISKEYRRRVADGSLLPDTEDSPKNRNKKISQLICRRTASYMTAGLYKGALWKMADLGIIHGLAAMEMKLINSIQRFSLYTQPLGPMVNHCRMRQPVRFNMKHCGDMMRKDNYNHWTYFSESGKLQQQINAIATRQLLERDAAEQYDRKRAV